MATKNIVTNVKLPDDVPSELLVLKYGVTNTSQGPYYLNEKSAKEVIAVYKKRGLKLFFDYQHLSLNPKTASDGIAAGWFDLSLKEDGIWAVNLKWTPKATAHLESKEYAYYSPTIRVNKNSHVVGLLNIALTNLPATDNLEPMVELSERLELDDLLAFILA